jgi:predicted transcriptional regulator of viral defense system
MTFGVETHTLEGVPVKITSRAKTVADCLKYRNKIGLSVALEALKSFVQKRQPGDLRELHVAAKVCRVERVLKPYLEAML